MASPWLQLGSRFFVGFGRASVEASGEALGKALPKGPLETINIIVILYIDTMFFLILFR
jgi:hypothetical protein